jgi:quinol monooxygenase YgiN
MVIKFAVMVVFAGLVVLLPDTLYGQKKSPMVRLAKIVVDSSRLEEYKAILKEEAEKSVQLEPGVLTLYAVSEKENPTHFTILEIYEDSAAYRAHLQTPHFIKYKTSTKDMVKSLELIESTPLIPNMKIK